MKRYVVTLEKDERDELAGVTRKGSHQSQKVINALILLNSDEGEFNEHRARGEAIAEILRISARKVDRIKKRFVEEGMEAALGGRQGRRSNYVRRRVRGAPGGAGPLAMVAAVAGRSHRGARPHRQCFARDGAPGPEKKRNQTGSAG